MQSICESKRFSKLTTIEGKFAWIREQFASIRVHWSEEHRKIHISRNEILYDSIREIQNLGDKEMRTELQIQFIGEIGMDAGGVLKEWINILIKELFSQEMQLFQLTKTEEVSYIITPLNNKQPELYYFTGRILGKAIFENIPVNCMLCKNLYKHLLGLKVTYDDISYQDTELYNSLESLASNCIDGIFIGCFALETGNSEKGRSVYELIKNGTEVCITEENKKNYIDLRYEYEIYNSIEPALTDFKKGFNSVIPHKMIAELSPEELELLLCGKGFLDVDEWLVHTEYKGEYSSTHKVIRWFWATLREFSQDELSKLLVFVTGTSRVPLEGFANLKTLRGDPSPFTLQSVEYHKKVLPKAHTCFNRLDLPLYTSKNELKEALILVINCYALGFGLE